jgi:hypothetical protein
VIPTELDEYLWFIDDFLDTMAGIVEGLGDDLANTRPTLPGANSPYAILTHCLGVMAWWGGEMVAGHDVERDRPAEFTATGPTAELREKVRRARAEFTHDLEHLDGSAPPARTPDADYADLPYGRTQGGVLLHVLQELAQHLGHLEITRDLLLAGHPTPEP